MTRRVLTVLLFLLLGAIVNVAVAWGYALRLPLLPSNNNGAMASVEHEGAMILIQQRPGDTRITIQPMQRASLPNIREISRAEFDAMIPHGSVFGDMQWIANELAAARPALGDSVLLEHSHGWPMLAMSGWISLTRSVKGPPTVAKQEGLREIGPLRLGPFSTQATYRRLLPLHPFWPGFALNTLFYAAILWALFAVPAALRRKRRIKRGLCPACAYPVGESSVCTECGRAVR